MAIKFKEVSYIYAADMPYAFKALDHIDLEFAMHKKTAIIGETGSGKSTLVQHLNALLIPSFGEVEVLDHELKAGLKNKGLKALRAKVGLVFQFSEYQLFEESIIKDVAFGPKNFGDDEATALNKAQKALALVGLDASYYERSPLELSGGQKRRVAIAGILAMDPEVIVLDEPTAGLDPKGTRAMLSLFERLNRDFDKTIIIVTHDNEIVYHHCDNVVYLSKGKVKYSGAARTFFEEGIYEGEDLLLPKDVQFINALKKQGFKLDTFDLDQAIKETAKVLKNE